MFAISVFFLNHAKVDTNVFTSVDIVHDVVVPDGIAQGQGRDAADRARKIAEQVGVNGEIGFVRSVREGQRVVFPISRPGLEAVVDVNLPERIAVVSRRTTGLLESIAYLHKMPGPHNANLRGNWFWTQAWMWLADASVYLLLLISVTGLFLWITIRSERRAGVVILAASALSFAGLLFALVG